MKDYLSNPQKLPLLCMVALWLVFDISSFGSQEFGLSVSGKETRPVLYFSDDALEVGNPLVEYAVILVHGLNGGTNDCTTSIRNSLGRRYPDSLGRVLFVAPCFLSDDLDSPLCSHYAYWSGSRWSSGYDSLAVTNLSSYDVMDTIIGILSDNDKYPRLKHVFVGGFSAGGQYVIRYVCVGNFKKRDGVQYDFAPGSPSSWLYLDNQRIHLNGDLSPYASEYPGYDNWKYGLQNRNRYAGAVSCETILENVSTRRVLCFCGTADDDPAGKDLDVTAPAMAQGTTRYSRYLNYREYASRHPEWYVNFSFVEIPGIAHSSSECYADKRILDFVMGYPIGWNCDEDGNRIKNRFVNADVSEEGDGMTRGSAIKSLRNAISQAEDGDSIYLSAGVYPAVNTKGKRVVIEGIAGEEKVFIDGGTSNQCVCVGSSDDVRTNSVFRNLIIRNGWAGNGGGARGGVFENCTFIDNVATNSGGACFGSHLLDCIVQSNSASYGAGLFLGAAWRTQFLDNRSSLSGAGARRSKLYNSLVMGNMATGASACGGGCYECTNRDCVVQCNYAGLCGGGAYRGVYERCIFSWNKAASTGGGTYDGILTDCLVVSNSASYAGGLSRGRANGSRIVDNDSTYVGGGTHRSHLTNSLIIGNRAGSSGGGCYECTNVNCTIYGNYAGNRGGGVYAGSYTNCIVWGNTSGNGYADVRTTESCGYCLLGTYIIGVGNQTGDPKMNAPNKGDFRLSLGSPCLNAGCNFAVDGEADALGHSRIQDGVVDMGACEGVAKSTWAAPVDVPYTWLEQYPALMESVAGDYELAAYAKTGKKDSWGRDMCVWEDYVVGTNPMKSNDVFKAYIDMIGDKVIISYSPVFSNESCRAMRKYTIQGKKLLWDKDWCDVPTGSESEYNFFRVQVEMR